MYARANTRRWPRVRRTPRRRRWRSRSRTRSPEIRHQIGKRVAEAAERGHDAAGRRRAAMANRARSASRHRTAPSANPARCRRRSRRQARPGTSASSGAWQGGGEQRRQCRCRAVQSARRAPAAYCSTNMRRRVLSSSRAHVGTEDLDRSASTARGFSWCFSSSGEIAEQAPHADVLGLLAGSA